LAVLSRFISMRLILSNTACSIHVFILTIPLLTIVLLTIVLLETSVLIVDILDMTMPGQTITIVQLITSARIADMQFTILTTPTLEIELATLPSSVHNPEMSCLLNPKQMTYKVLHTSRPRDFGRERATTLRP
jgi:hypothetical protein